MSCRSDVLHCDARTYRPFTAVFGVPAQADDTSALTCCAGLTGDRSVDSSNDPSFLSRSDGGC
ncbi:MAG: hypothetical protein IT436_02915 [Phycisphaerales bacterium]|nr:hypothetical protein [Phycisphaerales bacterium]